VLPQPVAKQHEFFGKDQGLRIKDLVDPTKKMSKSDDSDRGVIFLGDNPGNASHKIINATTDSVGVIKKDPENQPGITNLLTIFELLGGKPEDFYSGSSEYSAFKNTVAEMVEEFIAEFQRKLADVDVQKLRNKLESDEKAMTEQANKTLLKVQQAIGLRPKS
jgi:tryptophanyl-tRNA synthetase